MRLSRARYWGAAGVLLSAAAAWLLAHEGHQPLPTRGAAVDVAAGKVTLSAEARGALAVQSAPVRLEALDDALAAPAGVVAPWQRRAYAAPLLPGRVAALHVRPGQPVRRGQTLAEVESQEFESLKLELLDAHNEARLTAANLADLEKSLRAGASRVGDVLELHNRLAQQQAAVDLCKRKLLNVGCDPGAVDQLLAGRDPRGLPTLPVQSLLDGVALRVDVGLGQVVEAAQHLVEVVDLTQVWVKLGVLEQDLHRVAPGMPVELHFPALPGEALTGAVALTGLHLDPVTHQGEVWADLANPGERLLPGMVGQALIRIPAPKKSLLIPAAALVDDGAERFVFVEEGPGQYTRQPVVTGRRTTGLAQILESGLVPGDRVVTAGSHELASFFVRGTLRLSKEAVKNLGVAVGPVGFHSVQDVTTLEGAVDLPPDRRALASARLAGTVVSLPAGRGQAVRPGDVLAEVASLEFQNWQLDLVRSHQDVALFEQTQERRRPLAGTPALPARQGRETESALRAAVQRRATRRQQLRAAGLTEQQLDDLVTRQRFLPALPVRAPAAGTLARGNVVLGQSVKAEEPLFEIHDVSQVLVQGFATERDLARVRPGQPARVRLAGVPGPALEGTVVRTGRSFTGDTRTLPLWVEPRGPVPPGVRHGMLATVTLPGPDTTPQLAVPADALVWQGTQAFVFVHQPGGTFTRRPVTTGARDDTHVAVVAGLRPEEPVALGGAEALQTAYASLR